MSRHYASNYVGSGATEQGLEAADDEGAYQAAARITNLPEEGFYVYLKENLSENIGVGGNLLSDK